MSERISNWKWLNVANAIILPIVIATNIWGLYSLKHYISENQAEVVIARQQNKDRQDNIINYARCIVLLRFDNPNLGPSSTKPEVSAALDKCAVDDN